MSNCGHATYGVMDGRPRDPPILFSLVLLFFVFFSFVCLFSLVSLFFGSSWIGLLFFQLSCFRLYGGGKERPNIIHIPLLLRINHGE